MPYRRGKRNFKRTGKRRGKKAVKRVLQKLRSQGKTFMKLRTTPALASDGSGNISFGISTTDISLTTSANGGAYSNSVYDFTNVTGLWDQYRVYAIKCKYIPDYPNNVTATTTYKPIYSYIDYDSPTTASTTQTCVEYENCKIMNLYRPWTVYRRIPKTINPSGSGPVVSFGWMDLANPMTSGHLGFVAVGASSLTTWGSMLVTYYVGLKDRR